MNVAVLKSCQFCCFHFAVDESQYTHSAPWISTGNVLYSYITPWSSAPWYAWRIKILPTPALIFWCFLPSSNCHLQSGHMDSPAVLEENFKSNSVWLSPFKLKAKFPLTSAGVQFTANTSNGNWNMQTTDMIKHFWAIFFNLAVIQFSHLLFRGYGFLWFSASGVFFRVI